MRKGKIKKRIEEELGTRSKCEEWYRLGGRVGGNEVGGLVGFSFEGGFVGSEDATVPLFVGDIESDFGI